jgi:hypothetical protein
MAFNFLACADTTSSQTQIVKTEKKATVENSFEVNQYAVYDALITDEALSKDVFGKPDSLVILERTNTDYRDDPMLDTVLTNVQKGLPSLSKAMVDDFRAKNKTRIPLKDSFTLSAKRVFISDEELKKTINGGLDWKAFYKEYPNSQGVMTLSNVGFDAEMKRAFVYVANTRGGLNGVGLYVVLEKQGGVWKVKEKATGWMS